MPTICIHIWSVSSVGCHELYGSDGQFFTSPSIADVSICYNLGMEEDHALSTRRIESFSDGIFAVAATILVLDLQIPSILTTMTNQIALTTLLHFLPQFISFTFSFFTICIFWMNHHEFFHALKRADSKLLWLNILLLFWLCLLPFPTSFIGRFPFNTVSVIFYGSVLFMAAVSFMLMSHYALFVGKLYDKHMSIQERWIEQRRTYWGVALYGLSVILAPLSVYLSLILFVIVPVIYFIPRRVRFTPTSS